jgi:hypothetical protein
MLNPGSDHVVGNALNAQVLLQKIQLLPLERMLEVDDFVEFLHARILKGQADMQDRDLVRRAAQVSRPSFAAVWDNTEDSAYDAL